MLEMLGDNIELGDSVWLIVILLFGFFYYVNEMCWLQWNVFDVCLDQEMMLDQNLRMVVNQGRKSGIFLLCNMSLIICIGKDDGGFFRLFLFRIVIEV